MKELINGISNEQLLFFTDALGASMRAPEHTSKAQTNGAYFKGEDLTITDQNRAEVLKDAEASARQYAASRNKRGTMPKTQSRDDAGVVAEVTAWLDRRRLRGHGKRDGK